MNPDIERELLALKGSDKRIHPGDVVEWARAHPKSQLHGHFEWDDRRAGAAYRLDQARRLIALHIVTASGERRMISLSIDRAKGGGYRDIADVVRSPKLRDLMLREALAELRRVQRKFAQLDELARIFAEIDKAERKFTTEEAE